MELEINALLADGSTKQPKEGSPQYGAIYVVSKENWDKNTTPGAVSLVSIRHGAELIVANTHALASDSEIAAYQAEITSFLRARKQAEIESKKFIFEMAKPEDEDESPNPAAQILKQAQAAQAPAKK